MQAYRLTASMALALVTMAAGTQPCRAQGGTTGQGKAVAGQSALGTGSSAKVDAGGSGSTMGNGGAYTGASSTGAAGGAPTGNGNTGSSAHESPPAPRKGQGT